MRLVLISVVFIFTPYHVTLSPITVTITVTVFVTSVFWIVYRNQLYFIYHNYLITVDTDNPHLVCSFHKHMKIAVMGRLKISYMGFLLYFCRSKGNTRGTWIGACTLSCRFMLYVGGITTGRVVVGWHWVSVSHRAGAWKAGTHAGELISP
jgi:hypothetical protein